MKTAIYRVTRRNRRDDGMRSHVDPQGSDNVSYLIELA